MKKPPSSDPSLPLPRTAAAATMSVALAFAVAVAAAAGVAAIAPHALAQLDGSDAVADTTDEFNALLAETVADVFGRSIDEITGGIGIGGPPAGGIGIGGPGAPGGGDGTGTGSSTSANNRGIDTDIQISLHIPPKMIVGVQYEGMLFIAEPRTVDTPVVIVVDGGTRVAIPSAVVIPAGDNHAVFPVRADDVHDHAVLGAEQTTLTVHAIPPIGEQAMADTTVYLASFKAAALHIAAPTGHQSSDTVRTITGKVPIRVILVDSSGTPIDAERDVAVHLTSSSSTVRFSAGAGYVADITLDIPAGESSVDAVVDVNGDATVYAGAVGLRSDSVLFDHDDRDITVHMGVAPSPAVQTTVGYYYVWLEKGGSMYIPDDILDVRLSSSDPEIVRFTSDVGPGGEFYYGLMEGGMMRGTFFAIKDGEAGLFASVAGYGVTEETIEVWPRVSDDAILVAEGDFDESWLKLDTPNTLRLWVYPDVPADHAWAVVGLYTTPFDLPSTTDSAVANARPVPAFPSASASVVVGGNSTAGGSVRPSNVPAGPPPAAGPRTATGDDVEGCDAAACPVHGYNIHTTFTSDGGLHHPPSVDIGSGIAAGSYDTKSSRSVRTSAAPDAQDPDGDLHQVRHFPSSAAELPLRAVTATGHTLTVSADGMYPDTIEFASRPAYGYEGETMVTPIPARMDDPAEIAFVSLTDGDGGYIIGPGATHRHGDARVIQTGGAIQNLEIGKEWVGGTAVLRGTFTDERAEVFVQVPGLHSGPVQMDVPGAHSGVEAWLPPRVNVGEPFPLAIHTVNSEGVPVEAIRDGSVMRIASGDVAITSDGAGGSLRMKARGHGIVQFNLVADGVFAATAPIESFTNPHEADVAVGSPTSEVISLGESIVINIDTGSIGDPSVTVEGTGGLEFAADPARAGRYVAVPGEAGSYTVGVRVAGDGWDTYEDSLAFSVEEFVEASYVAIADDGVSVPSSLILTALTVPEDGTLNVPNGGGVSVHPGIFEATIDTSITIGGDRIYGLTGLQANGEPVVVSEQFTLPVQRDTVVRATYQRGIDIDFAPIFDSEDPDVAVSVEGSGSYRYGEAVVLEAVPAPETYGLVWHMPEKWGGLPEDAVVSPDRMTARFEALETSVGSVEFRRDYSIMTLLVVLGAGACGFVVWRKAPADTIYNIQDGLLNVGGKLTTIVERPKAAKKGRKKKGRAGGDAGGGDGADGGGDDGDDDDEDDDGAGGNAGEDDGEGKKPGKAKEKEKEKEKKKRKLGGGLRSLIKGGDED